MQLLKFEIMKSEPGTIAEVIGTLVRSLRYYAGNETSEELLNEMPNLKKLEAVINEHDERLGLPTKNYIVDIMVELNEEWERLENVIDEMQRQSSVITRSLYGNDFKFTDFDFEYKNSEAVYWVQFNGYKDGSPADGTQLLIKEVFRSVCSGLGVVFIDQTLLK